MRCPRPHTARFTGSLALALVLTGACGNEPGTRRAETVTFVVANDQLNFAVEMMDGFRAGAAAVGGVNHVVVGPPTVDGPRQVQLFKSVPKSSRSGVSVFTLSPELFNGPLSEAVRAGVPIIAVDNPPGSSANVPLFVGNDNYDLGRMLADEVINAMPPNAVGKVIIGTSTPGVAVLELRAEGMRDEFRKRQPSVTVVGPFDTKQDVQANLTSWQALVNANPGALAFLGTGDADGWNLAAIRRSTRGAWQAGAFDLDPRSLQAAKDGDLVLISPEHYVKGAITGRLQASHAKEGTALPKGWLLTPGLAVTRANVDAVMARQASAESRKAWFAPQVDDILGHVQDHLRAMPDV